MENNYLWKIIETKPGAEKKVCDQLSKKIIDYYCPLNKTYKRWNDKTIISKQPLFKGYVFAKIGSAQSSVIKNIEGVKGFLYWRNNIATINLKDLNTIKRFINDHEHIKIEKIQVTPDEANGFGDFDGSTREVYRIIGLKNDFEKVLIESIGYALVSAKVQLDVDIIKIGTPKYSIQSLFNSSYR